MTNPFDRYDRLDQPDRWGTWIADRLGRMTGKQWLFAAICIVLLISWAGQPSKNPAPTSPAPAPAVAHPMSSTVYPSTSEQRVTAAHWGCQDAETYNAILRWRVQGDLEAARRRLALESVRGQCDTFEAGERVYLDDVGILSGLVKVRKPGEPVGFWMGIRMVTP